MLFLFLTLKTIYYLTVYEIIDQFQWIIWIIYFECVQLILINRYVQFKNIKISSNLIWNLWISLDYILENKWFGLSTPVR